ncbi:MAG: D-2-hydroxyacid dehydrogenase [Saprospiraceae bacterium]|nr:D-2-hydroxyacid dehydrogenase [Saprospiraceae bacterium]
MKIIVLDGYTLNPNDLSWSALAKLGDLTVYDRTPADKIIERAAQADILIVNKVVISAQQMEQLPKLRYIGVLATGYNNIDVVSAKNRGIVVCNVRNYGTATVAQQVFSLLLTLTNHAESYAADARQNWANAPDWTYWHNPLMELSGKTIGVIGLGNIGSQVAKIAQAFGMKTISTTQKETPEGKSGQAPQYVDEKVGLGTLLLQSDVISLHCPLSENTKELINIRTLSLMKPTAFLINTARGGLIHEQDLADALNKGVIAGAGLDVLTQEPPLARNPLLTAKNCFITPHQAWASFEARQRLMDLAVGNIEAFLAGKPINQVS